MAKFYEYDFLNTYSTTSSGTYHLSQDSWTNAYERQRYERERYQQMKDREFRAAYYHDHSLISDSDAAKLVKSVEKKEESPLDWLHKRVNEVCDEALAAVA